MTKKECKKFTAGFFKSFHMRLKTLEDAARKTMSRNLMYQMEDGSDPNVTLVKLEELRDCVVEVGNLRTMLNAIFRSAKMEATDYPEYDFALHEWQKTDRFIFNSYAELKERAKAAHKSREQG